MDYIEFSDHPIMNTYNALNLWALNQLYEFGFGQDLKKVTLDSVSRKPMQDQAGFNKNNWAGVYHIFEVDHVVYLYMHNELENKTNIVSKEINISLTEIMNLCDPVDPNDLLASSRKSALDDPKFKAETQRLDVFISKSLQKKNSINNDPNGIVVSQECQDKSLSPLPFNSKIEDKLNVEPELMHQQNHDQFKTEINEILNSIECDDCFTKLTVGGLLEIYSLTKYTSVNSYKVVEDLNITIYGHATSLKKGDILLPLQNKKNDQLAVLKLEDNLLIESYKVISRNDLLVNCYFIGDGSNESDKWLFVANDLSTALSIQALTKVKVLVCETIDYPNDPLSSIHERNPKIKLGYFVPEIKTITQKIKLGQLDAIGVHHFYIDSSSNVATWNDFIALRNNSETSFQQFIKDAVKLESDRVKKLQS